MEELMQQILNELKSINKKLDAVTSSTKFDALDFGEELKRLHESISEDLFKNDLK